MAVRRVGTACLAIAYAAPWVWVLCLGIFASAVTIKVGHFPSYSNPDPKHVDSLHWLSTLTLLLLVAAFLSPLVIGTHAAVALLRRGHADGVSLKAAVYLAGLSLAGIVFFGDAFGLATWLLD